MHKKYSLLYTTVLCFVACRVTSKSIGKWSAEHSWGDVKTIKSGKISSLGSDISEKQSIVYTSACIEEVRIGRTLSHTDSKDGSHSHTWNNEDHAFDYQSDQWGVEKFFQNGYEAITRELKMYIEKWGKTISRTRAKYQKPCFLKNTGVWLYTMKIWKIFIIDHKQLQYNKTDG